jgi:hypothetical protein
MQRRKKKSKIVEMNIFWTVEIKQNLQQLWTDTVLTFTSSIPDTLGQQS